jgi:hypothetical protein
MEPLAYAVDRVPRAASTVAAVKSKVLLEQLVAEFLEVFSQPFSHTQPQHGVQHVIETVGRPVFAKARRLDAEKLRVAQEEFRKLEEAGIIRRSTSPWASPLHMVPAACSLSRTPCMLMWASGSGQQPWQPLLRRPSTPFRGRHSWCIQIPVHLSLWLQMPPLPT